MYLALGILVGTGLQQKLHALRLTFQGGTNQRRLSVLPVGAQLRTTQLRTRWQTDIDIDLLSMIGMTIYANDIFFKKWHIKNC